MWVSGGSVGLKNTKNTERTQLFILVWAIRALHPAADDPCIQEHPNQRVTTRSIRDLAGIVGANHKLIGGEVSFSSERKKTMEREELSVLLSGWPC